MGRKVTHCQENERKGGGNRLSRFSQVHRQKLASNWGEVRLNCINNSAVFWSFSFNHCFIYVKLLKIVVLNCANTLIVRRKRGSMVNTRKNHWNTIIDSSTNAYGLFFAVVDDEQNSYVSHKSPLFIHLSALIERDKEDNHHCLTRKWTRVSGWRILEYSLTLSLIYWTIIRMWNNTINL